MKIVHSAKDAENDARAAGKAEAFRVKYLQGRKDTDSPDFEQRCSEYDEMLRRLHPET